MEFRDVSRIFAGGLTAIEGVSLDVAAGEFVAVLGPSGCGKSTLLRLVAGLDRPQRGEVMLGGEAAAESSARRRHALAFVFQDAHLLPWRRVLGNVELPLELAGVARVPRREAALRALGQVELTEAIRQFPAQLSGGMRMRVSLARALVVEPSVLLLDEPFAALDELTRHRLDEELHRLWRARRMTVVFVTHSIPEAAFLGQRVVVLSRRPGRVIADVTVDLPSERNGELRTSPPFNALVRRLAAELEAGG